MQANAAPVIFQARAVQRAHAGIEPGEMPVDTATPQGDMFVHRRAGVMGLSRVACGPPVPALTYRGRLMRPPVIRQARGAI